jgi:HAD superfamily hydrolase (TIGR01549 family)
VDASRRGKMEKPKAILFDFADTIFHETKLDWDKGNLWLFNNAINPNKVTFEEFNEHKERIYSDIRPKRMSSLIEHSWAAAIRLIFESLRMIVKTDTSTEIEYFKKVVEEYLAPGITNILETIENYNIRTGIVSNNTFCGKTLEKELETYGIRKYFEFVISSADYGIRKPHPFIFELARGKLGLKSNEIWFIGDNRENDYIASKNVGMIPFLYTGSTNRTEDIIENVIQSWDELETILKRIENNR